MKMIQANRPPRKAGIPGVLSSNSKTETKARRPPNSEKKKSTPPTIVADRAQGKNARPERQWMGKSKAKYKTQKAAPKTMNISTPPLANNLEQKLSAATTTEMLVDSKQNKIQKVSARK